LAESEKITESRRVPPNSGEFGYGEFGYIEFGYGRGVASLDP
jgi:hypothetical protein